ncbi:MAG: DUF4177 domain-containing protein [Acidimicrobiales bacterium]
MSSAAGSGAMWEYKFIDSQDVARTSTFKSKSTEDIEAYFNALGREGWEIVALDFSDMKTVFYGVAKRRIN